MGQRYSDYRHLILPGNKENILILILNFETPTRSDLVQIFIKIPKFYLENVWGLSVKF